MIGPNTEDFSGLVEYFSPGRRMFHCHCPEGVSGDLCDRCDIGQGHSTSQQFTGVCSECDCSSSNMSAIYNTWTGQCQCENTSVLSQQSQHCLDSGSGINGATSKSLLFCGLALPYTVFYFLIAILINPR